MSEFQSVNEGTSNKGKLQEIATECIKNYPSNQPLKTYAELLSWDLKLSFRTALESYVLPMMRKGYFIHVTGDTYTQASNSQRQNTVTNTCKNCNEPITDNLTQKEESFMEYVEKHPHGTCKNCGKPTFNTDFCSKECAKEYKAKEEVNS